VVDVRRPWPWVSPRKPRRGSLGERFQKEGIPLEQTRYQILPPLGDHIDLLVHYRRVLRRYLPDMDGRRLPRVGWSPLDHHNAWALYGLLDDAILIEKSLDDPATPPFVVEYLILHELLHLRHPPDEGSDQAGWHTAAFERAIAAFPHGQEAEEWLDSRLEAELRPAGAEGARAPVSRT
jgi:hypothetical protein